MVLNIRDLSVKQAAEIICRTVSLERFRTTPESQGELDDRVLAARVRAILVQFRPGIDLSAEKGRVRVELEAREAEEAALCRAIERRAKTVPGVQEVKIHVHHSVRHYD
jgi:hypothetical protein